MIKITNADEITVRRYGIEFEPGETKEIDPLTLQTYSLMEISRASQIIARKLTIISKTLEDSEKRESRTVVNQSFSLEKPYWYHDEPWLVRKWNQRKEKKRWEKEWKLKYKTAKGVTANGN